MPLAFQKASKASRFLSKTIKATACAAVLATASMGVAQAESPFHTGVWQLNTEEGPRGFIASDWLIFEDGLPKRWLYRRAGTNDSNQFDFFTRELGEDKYSPLGIRFYRTGPNAMQYTVARKKEAAVEVSANRLSIVNYKGSCLSVENKGERLLGKWTGTVKSDFNYMSLTRDLLTIDGRERQISVEPVRVGRLAIIEDGKPLAFLTDAGGDYAVLQWFEKGVSLDTVRNPAKEIMKFKDEEVVRNPAGDCDRQIRHRLDAMS
ncbi:hypothetical protein PsAD2_03315 [Pseudovibrio axinellae]|uniref:Uncharacterized protein n=1 Tax=Pseudovibrio axinellae TaxID=989403 RepID=A0A165WSH9_9HYPH|nr:hypothetical protein [Pseudovibrio axinellae]KZL16842.1 hypothetical protein PsAD2_03315 [Pseudovibrio axinellae]SER67210.1 hypothetical protein SAMN05421798_1162 [Pseudovibrio axinellae]